MRDNLGDDMRSIVYSPLGHCRITDEADARLVAPEMYQALRADGKVKP